MSARARDSARALASRRYKRRLGEAVEQVGRPSRAVLDFSTSFGLCWRNPEREGRSSGPGCEGPFPFVGKGWAALQPRRNYYFLSSRRRRRQPRDLLLKRTGFSPSARANYLERRFTACSSYTSRLHPIFFTHLLNLRRHRKSLIPRLARRGKEARAHFCRTLFPVAPIQLKWTQRRMRGKGHENTGGANLA